MTIFLETPYPQRAWARLLKPDQPASTPVEIAEGKSQAIGTVQYYDKTARYRSICTKPMCCVILMPVTIMIWHKYYNENEFRH